MKHLIFRAHMKHPLRTPTALTCTLALLAGVANLGATQFISNLGNTWGSGIGDIQTLTPGQDLCRQVCRRPGILLLPQLRHH